jgi:uncharacterized protein YqeY
MVAGVDSAIDCADLRARLSAALKVSMRARDQVAVAALRSALGAIGNAEAVPADQHAPKAAPGQDGPHFAGATAGLGAAETPRRVLSPADLNAIMRAEISERTQAADQYAASGFTDQAERLRREAAVLTSVLLPADPD